MTTSELNGRLNDILEYMRDCDDTTNILPLCINVPSIRNLSDNTFLMLMHTLIDDKYIKAEKEEMSISNAYYIIKEGIYFINSGGYPKDLTNTIVSESPPTTLVSKPKNKPQIPEKWSALLYLIEIAISGESLPENIRGQLSKSELMKIGQQRGYNTEQYFYDSVKRYSLERPNIIAKEYHPDWKQKLITLSNNDEKIINFLKEKYR